MTFRSLLTALVEHEVLDSARIASLLGENRDSATLPQFELALVQENILGAQRLLAFKGALSHLPVHDDPRVVPVTDPVRRLREDVARATGSILLELPEPTVAMVEDRPENVAAVAAALGVPAFTVWLTTAPQFVEMFRTTYQGEIADTRPGALDIYEVFTDAVRRRASDIHLSVGVPPAARVDGRLMYLPYQPLDELWMRNECLRLAGEERMGRVYDRAGTRGIDFAYTFGSSRFRINVAMDKFGLTMAARKLPTQIPTMDDLDLPPAIRRFAELERGLVLVTGPTGSGKSTTLAGLLHEIIAHQDRHVITLEDPIEYQLTSARSIVHQRELGRDFSSFPEGLRQALRQDPDVILVGELRDLETMRTAVSSAETGHLVFGTLHTYDASSTLARLVGSFPPEEQEQIRATLAYILRGVVSQTLIPRKAGRGRVAAFEVLVSTPGVANNLRKPDGHLQIKQALETGIQHGMMTMDMALAELVKNGKVRQVDAEARVRNQDDFLQRLA